ncbi:MAG: helix-turn-helix domain-containing protein [Bermanella sp.]
MHIGLAVYPGCIPSGLFAFAELLEVANQLMGQRFFTTSWVAQDHHAVDVHAGSRHGPVLSITPEHLFSSPQLDAILLPGMWTSSQNQLEKNHIKHQSLINALKDIQQNTQVFSYCSAVSLVARSGRLKEQEATSTWWMAEYLKEQHPNTQWRFSRTLVVSTLNTTASGVNGYLPIALSLVEQHCGQKVLRDVTKMMVLPRPETQQHPFQAVDLMMLNDELLRKIYLWVEKTPARKLTTTAMAEFLNMSERTLARKVKAAMGESCMHFMRMVKLNQASENLILTNMSISAISEQLGFVDDTTFRRSFKKVSGHTPGDYRQVFKRENSLL